MTDPIGKLPFEKITRKVIVKVKSETDASKGCIPHERSVPDLLSYGIININKPKGPTSHQVSDYVKKILKLDRAGQSGTLDPAVTGVLPIGLSKATRVLQTLLHCGKEYVCLMHIHKPQSEDVIRASCAKFIGKIRQLPPLKSAVKREWRTREIYYLNIHEIVNDGQDVLFTVGCEAGTYIRRICDDIGKDLECGAHMAQLLRTKVGTFTDTDMVTLQDLIDAYEAYKAGDESKIREVVLPFEKAVEHIPKVWIHDSAIPYICNGLNLAMPGISKFESGIGVDDLVAILSIKGELIGLGHAIVPSEIIEVAEKGLAVSVDKIFMDPGVYK
jgi:H/ACA ribonucleoprotein complex subunit 4